MKNKQYRESRLLYELKMLRNKGEKSVVKKLSKETLELVKRFYRVEPASYWIEPRKRFSKEICKFYPVLRRINNAKRHYNMSFTKAELKVLRDFNIKYGIDRYLIHLVSY